NKMSDKSIWDHTAIKIGIPLTLVFGVYSFFGQFVTTQERGQDFLISQGFNNVTGGDNVSRFLNHCGHGAYSRDYQATTAHGETKNLRVCMSSGQNSYFDLDKYNEANKKAPAPRRR
ncbi:MAG: hypothetical protein VX803_02010, partial [Pseudomonadota bacterium]|nr:hypothetical protein [Pseudomonadota bacterium]